MTTLSAGLLEAMVRQHREGTARDVKDWVAVEEPLLIRIAEEPVAVTMRTPGHDHELALGFLLSEGVVKSARDLGSMFHCGRPGEAQNVIEVTAAPGAVLEWEPEAARRMTFVSASCGMCGRQSVDDLIARVGVVQDDTRFESEWIEGLGDQLIQAQGNFALSGGVHAAALWNRTRELIAVREDIGRHNAVDKVIGRAALDGALPLEGGTLLVSGRASFEIVQKAAVAAIPLIVSVSAPSSLAISAAVASRVTLIGFARGRRFNVYTGAERLILP
ncbi:MAG: formate dehydrogenase accessory sulfurtransferase FdhD [Polyangiaceae bacterium]